MDTYVISVNHKSSTGEWLASVNKNGRFYEPATAYVDDPEEAVDTAIATIKLYRKNGHRAELSNAQATLKQVSKYRPDFLIEETKRAIPVEVYARYSQYPKEAPIERPFYIYDKPSAGIFFSKNPVKTDDADKTKIKYNALGGYMV